MDGLDLVDPGPHRLDDLESAEGNAAGQAHSRAGDRPQRDLPGLPAIDAQQDQKDADGFLGVIERVIERQEGHIDPLGVCKEFVDAHTGAARQPQQQLQDAEAQAETHRRRQEDHQDHSPPEIVPGDGAGAKGRQPGTHHAADEGVGGRGRDPEFPGDEIPQDRRQNAAGDKGQCRLLRSVPGVICLPHQILDGIRHAGPQHQDQEGRQQLHHRSPGQGHLGPHGAAGDERGHHIASVVKAVYIGEYKNQTGQYHK